MLDFAASAAFVPAFMVVLGLAFACLGAYLLSARGAARTRDRIAAERLRRPVAVRGSRAWAQGREERLTRLLAFTWVAGGCLFALVGVVVLAVG
ncbi:hypothetical protein ACWDR3_31590 [Streptomyces sp. NPDC001002]